MTAELEKIMTQTWATIKELGETQKESLKEMDRVLTAKISELSDETNKRVADTDNMVRALTAKISGLSEETNKRVADTDNMVRALTAKISGLSEEINKWAGYSSNIDRELTAKISGLSEEINKWIGYSGNSIGNIVELILIPGIKKKMNELGHRFNSLAPRKQYFRKDGRTFTEVDLFLEDGIEVMAIEVKTQLSTGDVEYHLKRLNLLRKHESESGLKGKILLAAVAGLSIDRDAREMATKHGMYIIEMIEDDKNVNVIKPEGGLGKW
jgi:hypothetical protein